MIRRRIRNRASLNNNQKKKGFFSQHIYILLVIVGMIALIVIIIILSDSPSDKDKKSLPETPASNPIIQDNTTFVPIDTSPSVEYYDQESGDIIDSSKINLNDYDIINP